MSGKLISPVPAAVITAGAWTDLGIAARGCTTEISGVGLGRRIGSSFLIDEIRIAQQLSKPGANSIDDAWLHRFIHGLTEEEGGPGRWIMLFHSHPDIVYCSHTDLETVAAYLGTAFLSLVINARLEYYLRLDVREPEGLETVYELELELQLPPPNPERVGALCSDIEALVRVGRRGASARADLAALALPRVPLPRGTHRERRY